jgi:hypothetical protein
MGLYQVGCASVEKCPEDETLSHVTRVGLSGPEGAKVVKVSVARLMLSSGDTLTLGARGDEAAEARKGRCPACGAVTLRTRRKDNEDITDLPACD